MWEPLRARGGFNLWGLHTVWERNAFPFGFSFLWERFYETETCWESTFNLWTNNSITPCFGPFPWWTPSKCLSHEIFLPKYSAYHMSGSARVFVYSVFRGVLNRVYGILQLKYGYSVYHFLWISGIKYIYLSSLFPVLLIRQWLDILNRTKFGRFMFIQVKEH